MSDWLADLDAFLAEDGQDVVLRRVVGTTNQAFIDVTVRAVVRSPNANELSSGFYKQTDSVVIMSPTQITAAQWPGGGNFGLNPSLPKNGDWLILMDRTRKIEHVNPILVNDELIRIEMKLLGPQS